MPRKSKTPRAKRPGPSAVKRAGTRIAHVEADDLGPNYKTPKPRRHRGPKSVPIAGTSERAQKRKRAS